MRCLYCGKRLALLRKLTDGDFCSAAHRQRYLEEAERLAVARLLDDQRRSARGNQLKRGAAPPEPTVQEPTGFRPYQLEPAQGEFVPLGAPAALDRTPELCLAEPERRATKSTRRNPASSVALVELEVKLPAARPQPGTHPIPVATVFTAFEADSGAVSLSGILSGLDPVKIPASEFARTAGASKPEIGNAAEQAPAALGELIPVSELLPGPAGALSQRIAEPIAAPLTDAGGHVPAIVVEAQTSGESLRTTGFDLESLAKQEAVEASEDGLAPPCRCAVPSLSAGGNRCATPVPTALELRASCAFPELMPVPKTFAVPTAGRCALPQPDCHAAQFLRRERDVVPEAPDAVWVVAPGRESTVSAVSSEAAGLLLTGMAASWSARAASDGPGGRLLIRGGDGAAPLAGKLLALIPPAITTAEAGLRGVRLAELSLPTVLPGQTSRGYVAEEFPPHAAAPLLKLASPSPVLAPQPEAGLLPVDFRVALAAAGKAARGDQARLWPPPRPALPLLKLKPLVARKPARSPVVPAPEAAAAVPAPPKQPQKPWHGVSVFWRIAPADLKWLSLTLPVLLVVAVASTLGWFSSRPTVVAPRVSGIQSSGIRSAVNNSLATVRREISERAAINLHDDFRSGLADWDGRANWAREWQYDPAGFILTGSLALYRPSRALTDYQFEFLGQIEKKSLNWVFRAADYNNYYAMKIVLLKSNPTPTASIVRYAVVGGKQDRPVQLPLPIQVSSDTFYRVRVEVHGSDFTTTVLGQVVDTFSDSRLSSGGVGFFSDKGERARLRWFEVSHQYDTLGRLCALLAPYGGIPSADGSVNRQ